MSQATPRRRGKILLLAILCVLLIGAGFLIFSGIQGLRIFEDSGYPMNTAWSEALKLSGQADDLYRETLSPLLSGADEQTRSGSTAAVRTLLAGEWNTDEASLESFSDEQVWKLLAMSYSFSRKKLASAQRKALAAVADPGTLKKDLLLSISGNGKPLEDAVFHGVSFLAEADQATIVQTLMAMGNTDWSVLDRDTALGLTRAVGSNEGAFEVCRQAVSGQVSGATAWIMEHARTVILIGTLLAVDTLLLFFLLRADRSWKMDIKWILILAIVDFLLLFQLLPLIYLCVKAFFPNGQFSLETFTRLYTYKMNWLALKNTLIAATCTMILGTVLAFPLAWLVGRTNLYGRKFFRSLFVMTYMVPPYVGAMAWLRLLNKNVGSINLLIRLIFGLTITEGPLNIYSLSGLIWVLTTFYFPYAFITISRAMEKMDPSLEEASRISGASPITTVAKITFPMMTPSLIAGALLVFVAAASCYGIPSIIGAPGRVHTVTTRIIDYVGRGSEGMNDATGLGVFLMVLAIIILYISDFVVAKRQYITVSGKSTRPNIVDLGKWRTPVTVLVSLFACIVILIPFAVILITSFKVDLGKSLLDQGNFTLKQWTTIFSWDEMLDCLKNSFIFAIVTATIGIVVACTMSYLL